MILDSLDLEQIKFVWKLEMIFIFFLHFNFKNSVTKPFVILVGDSFKNYSSTAEPEMLVELNTAAGLSVWDKIFPPSVGR